jgi:hypothetical protein
MNTTTKDFNLYLIYSYFTEGNEVKHQQITAAGQSVEDALTEIKKEFPKMTHAYLAKSVPSDELPTNSGFQYNTYISYGFREPLERFDFSKYLTMAELKIN